MLRAFLPLIFTLLFGGFAVAGDLQTIIVNHKTPLNQEVHFILSKNTQYKVTQLVSSNIIRLEFFSNAQKGTFLKGLVLKLNELPSITNATIGVNKTTLVVEVKLNQHAWLSSIKHGKDRMIASLKLKNNTTNSSKDINQVTKPAAKTPAAKTPAAKTLVATKSIKKKNRKLVIIIDPGHGGKDSGALGSKLQEKNVNLRAAKMLHKKLNSIPQIKAYLTRSTDVFIPLQKRVTIASKRKAGLFLSIHSDAARSKKARGASVFALSIVAASKKSKRLLNSSGDPVLGYGKIELKSYPKDLAKTLLDLSQRSLQHSSQIGESMVKYLSQSTRMHSKQVKHAAFQVLKSFDFPSILIEMGFISNLKDERNLGSEKWLNDFTTAVTNGLKTYFKQNPNFINLYSSG